MQYRKEISGLYVVSLERGEFIRSTIEGLCVKEGIRGAMLSGIGALEDPELGFYRLNLRNYDHRTFQGIFELVSLQGNITLKDDKPFMHVHVAIGDEDFQVFGGHLFDARVGVVVELFLTQLERPLLRLPCEDIGLPRWEPNAS